MIGFPSSRRAFLAALTVAPALARAQSARVWRIGMLDQWYSVEPTGPARRLVTNMTERGYVDGMSVRYALRHAGGDRDRLAQYAEELVAAKPHAIVAMGGISTQAIARATSTIPVVAWLEDPVKAGLADSSLMPKANVTGIVDRGDERARKGLEMIKAMIPGLANFGMLLPKGNQAAEDFTKELDPVARRLGMRLVVDYFATKPDIERAFIRFGRERVGAAVAWPAPGLASVQDMVRLALDQRIGLVSEGIGGRFGVLLSFSPVLDTHRMADQLDRVLRGTPVARIPFERSDRYAISINRKTADALGISITPEMQLLATEVFNEWESPAQK